MEGIREPPCIIGVESIGLWRSLRGATRTIPHSSISHLPIPHSFLSFCVKSRKRKSAGIGTLHVGNGGANWHDVKVEVAPNTIHSRGTDLGGSVLSVFLVPCRQVRIGWFHPRYHHSSCIHYYSQCSYRVPNQEIVSWCDLIKPIIKEACNQFLKKKKKKKRKEIYVSVAPPSKKLFHSSTLESPFGIVHLSLTHFFPKTVMCMCIKKHFHSWIKCSDSHTDVSSVTSSQ